MFLPPANEVWGKVIFLHLFVILFTRGVPGQEGACSRGGAWAGGYGGVCMVQGVPGLEGGFGGCLFQGAWWRPPRDGYCCGWYASYWNAFLLYLFLNVCCCTLTLNSTALQISFSSCPGICQTSLSGWLSDAC